eukprot:tig00020531_g10005.t1
MLHTRGGFQQKSRMAVTLVRHEPKVSMEHILADLVSTTPDALPGFPLPPQLHSFLVNYEKPSGDVTACWRFDLQRVVKILRLLRNGETWTDESGIERSVAPNRWLKHIAIDDASSSPQWATLMKTIEAWNEEVEKHDPEPIDTAMPLPPPSESEATRPAKRRMKPIPEAGHSAVPLERMLHAPAQDATTAGPSGETTSMSHLVSATGEPEADDVLAELNIMAEDEASAYVLPGPTARRRQQAAVAELIQLDADAAGNAGPALSADEALEISAPTAGEPEHVPQRTEAEEAIEETFLSEANKFRHTWKHELDSVPGADTLGPFAGDFDRDALGKAVCDDSDDDHEPAPAAAESPANFRAQRLLPRAVLSLAERTALVTVPHLDPEYVDHRHQAFAQTGPYIDLFVDGLHGRSGDDFEDKRRSEISPFMYNRWAMFAESAKQLGANVSWIFDQVTNYFRMLVFDAAHAAISQRSLAELEEAGEDVTILSKVLQYSKSADILVTNDDLNRIIKNTERAEPGSPEYMRKFFGRISAISQTFGPANAFFTMSNNDREDPTLFRAIDRERFATQATIDRLTSHERVKAFFHLMASEGARHVFGGYKLTGYVNRFQEQSRQALHAHAILWFEGMPLFNDAMDGPPEGIRNFLQLFHSICNFKAELPRPEGMPGVPPELQHDWATFYAREFAAKYQQHNHTRTCYMKTLVKQRFDVAAHDRAKRVDDVCADDDAYAGMTRGEFRNPLFDACRAIPKT